MSKDGKEVMGSRKKVDPLNSFFAFVFTQKDNIAQLTKKDWQL